MSRKIFIGRTREESDTISNLRIKYKDQLDLVKRFKDESWNETFQQTVDKFKNAGFKVRTREFAGHTGALDDVFVPDEIELTSRYGKLYLIYYFPDNYSGY